MIRIILTAVLTTLVGCGAPTASDSASESPKAPDGDRSGQSESGKKTFIDVAESSLAFHPGTCVRGKAGFGWGLGSVQINIHGREHGFCIFDYTSEVEGGISVYRCRAPVNGPRIKIYVDNGSIATSFSLEKAKLIRSGNVHFRSEQDGDIRAAMKQQHVVGTDYVNYFTDVVDGTGAVVGPDSRVTIRYTLYVDDYFVTEYVGIKKNRPKEFTIGQAQVGRGIESAVQGLREGGKRRVMIREEVAPDVSKELGGVQPGTVLAMEIELLEVK